MHCELYHLVFFGQSRLHSVTFKSSSGTEKTNSSRRCVLRKDKIARRLCMAGEAGFHQSVVANRAVTVEMTEPPPARGGVLF